MRNKKSFLLAISLACCLSSCSLDEKVWEPQSEGGEITGSVEQNDTINKRAFEILNLDYPGLENVKSYYEKNEYYLAMKALLDYYRLRTDVVNPTISLINVSIGDGEQQQADWAVDHKFYVKNFDDPETGEPYLFPDNADGLIDWAYQPVTDSEFRSQLYRMHWVGPQGKAYRVSGDEKYVNSWIEVYGDFLRQYPDAEANELGTYDPLPVAERLSGAVDAFFYFLNSVNFTPEWLSTYLVALYDQVEYITNHYYGASSGTGNNITVAQEVTVFKSALMFPELTAAQEWLTDGSTRLAADVENQFLDDGFLWEVDLSYHIGTVANFHDAMLMAEANGKTSLLPSTFVESLRKATEVVMNLTYPDYSVEAFNDTRPTSYTKSVLTRNFREYNEMFPDNDEMKWMATSGASGTKPTHLTKAFTSSGYYVLRSGWDANATMLIHTNNPTAAWHNQGDNGTFSLYQNGRHFFPDSGCFTYNNGSTREWWRSAKQHNTMTLDDKAIADENRNGTFLKMEEQDGNTAVVVTENQSYSNLKHRRAIFHVNREFFVIVDEGIGNAAGKVSVNFHLCDNAGAYANTKDYQNEVGDPANVVYDADLYGAHTAFSDGNNILVRTFSDTDAISFDSWTGKTSWVIDEWRDRKSYEIYQQKTADQTARFITVLLPYDGTSAKTVDAAFTKAYDANGAAVEVTVDGTQYQLSYTLN